MFENIGLSFQSIWNHKMRSFLTMLGIIIGIAAIITIVSTIKGTNDQIKQNLIGSGTNVVTVTLGMADGGYYYGDYSSNPEGVAVADEATRAALEELDGVREAAVYRTRSWADSVFYKNTAFNGGISGVDSHYFSVNGYQVVLGRGFTEEDFAQHRKVIILDAKAMNGMFEGTNPIGKTVEISAEPFTVVGIVAKSSASGPTINSLNDYYTYADTSSGTVYIPAECWSILYQYDEPMTIAVRAESTDDMTAAGSAAADLLNEMLITNTSYTYKANDLLSQATELQQLSASTNTQLLWIAGISLLVGGIGVMNIMLVSVTERTREIGLKKAIGARKGRILRQFLTEAGVLTSLGGMLGVAAGIGLAQMISNVMGTPVAISVPACIVAVAFSMAIGIIFGLIPAVKAANLNPIEALRRE